MKTLSPADKKRIKELHTQIKELQVKLVQAQKLEGKDVYVEVKVKKNQGRTERIKKKGVEDTVFGKFFLEIEVLAERQDVFIPLSIAWGKKTAGFMY
jgi:phage terminase large subunit-like protein